jgi:hypothetical protein
VLAKNMFSLESTVDMSRAGSRGRNGKFLLNGCRISAWGDEKFYE